MNIHLLAAKRAAELCQYTNKPYDSLTMIAALKQTAREFSRKEDKRDRNIKEIVS